MLSKTSSKIVSTQIFRQSRISCRRIARVDLVVAAQWHSRRDDAVEVRQFRRCRCGWNLLFRHAFYSKHHRSVLCPNRSLPAVSAQ